MKQTILICLISCLLYAECNGQNKKNKAPRPDADVTQTKLTKEDFQSEPIKFEEAVKDIARLLDHDELRTLTTYALGGMFCINDFYKPTGKIDTDTVRGTPSRYHEMNWAYFQNNYDKKEGEGTLTHLVKLPGATHIRYYFGFDPGKTGKNSIRIILFAVTEDGKNITDYIVQKSIPPAKK